MRLNDGGDVLAVWRREQEAKIARRRAAALEKARRAEARRARDAKRAQRQIESQIQKQARDVWHVEVARKRAEYRAGVEARRAARLADAPARAARSAELARAKAARRYARRKAHMAPILAARRAERLAKRAAQETACAAEREAKKAARAARTAVPLIARRRSEWLELRKGFKCSRCPEADPRTLEFHHPGEKRVGVHELVGRGRAMKKVLEEISRCEPLCANCHRKHHGIPARTTLDPDRRRYREWWDEVRATLRCAHCGEADPSTFEYIPRSSEVEKLRPLLKRLVSRDRVRRALEQTLVLCANCRRKERLTT